ncbi:MAG: hypothetical protein Q8862_08750 [Bacteroidota bacterium]|nr:hypothetical protein [Bacteroidota bacterium]
MKKCFLLLSILSLSAFGLKAQTYDHSVGVRVGYSSGIFYRYNVNSENSYSALLSSRDNGLQLTALREFNQKGIFGLPQEFSLIYGFGAHLGYTQWDVTSLYYYPDGVYTEHKSAGVAGLDGLVGLEYNINDIPLSVGLEIKPFFDFGGEHNFEVVPQDIALTFRFNF